jgi:hypothetical protein
LRHTLKQWVLQFEFIPSGVHLCRVTPIENLKSLPYYDEEKYKEMTLDAAETVLGFFGFDRTAYSNLKNNGRSKWCEELKEQSARDIETEML